MKKVVCETLQCTCISKEAKEDDFRLWCYTPRESPWQLNCTDRLKVGGHDD